jgi:hypothetical protein
MNRIVEGNPSGGKVIQFLAAVWVEEGLFFIHGS